MFCRSSTIPFSIGAGNLRTTYQTNIKVNNQLRFRQRKPKKEEDEEGPSVRAAVLHPFNKLQPVKTKSKLRPLTIPTLRLKEAVTLAQTLDWTVVHESVVPVRKFGPSYFGTGKVKELAELAESVNANVLVVDTKLTGIQQKNLEEEIPGVQIVDRFQLILEIFERRAQTREAQLQVELASLQHRRTSIVHLFDADYEQQRGATGAVAGAGETKLELTKREILTRQKKIRDELELIKKRRTTQRNSREGLPIVAILGYTNAGKSALINRLTGSTLLSKNVLFASLDSTMRGCTLPSGQKCVFVDTVGFISELPGILQTAFRSTLEEVKGADLIVHVRDVTHPESEYQKVNVHKILNDLEVSEELMDDHIEVWNKTDLLPKEEVESQVEEARKAQGSSKVTLLPISAKTGAGCDTLLNLVDRKLQSRPKGPKGETYQGISEEKE